MQDPYFVTMVWNDLEQAPSKRDATAHHRLIRALDHLAELEPRLFQVWYEQGSSRAEAQRKVFYGKAASFEPRHSEDVPISTGIWTGPLDNGAAASIVMMVPAAGRPSRMMLRFHGISRQFDALLWGDSAQSFFSRLVDSFDPDWGVLAPWNWQPAELSGVTVRVGWFSYIRGFFGTLACEAHMAKYLNGSIIRLGNERFDPEDENHRTKMIALIRCLSDAGVLTGKTFQVDRLPG